MTRTVRFFFDVGSPASYLAWTQLPRLCAEANATLEYCPMLLGGVFQATGNQSPATLPVKSRYTRIDFGRYAKRYGVPLQFNPHFPINTLFLMRAITAVQRQQPERLDALLRTIFTAMWVQGLDLNQPQLTARVLAQSGFDPDSLHAEATDPDTKAALKAITDEAVALGVFGAPTMFVGDEMFFGQDRLDMVREALNA